jgi:hypothetical protein
MKKVNKKQILIILGTMFVILVPSLTAYYFYMKYQTSQKLLKDPTSIEKIETQELVSKVGKLIELPQKETPTIATVTDSAKLKDQSFFAKAKNGDKVIIYVNEKMAILYDPTANIIRQVSPLNLTSQTASGSTQLKMIKVALYNGTKIVGLTNTVEKDLKAKIQNIEISEKVNAKKSDYQKTLVIDLTGGRKADVEALAQELKGDVGTLPEGEEKPKDAEILVILGQNSPTP